MSQVQAVEMLLLLGQIHQAAGAPLTALPYILSCLLHSTDLHMDLLVTHHASRCISLVLSNTWQHNQRLWYWLQARYVQGHSMMSPLSV